MMERWTDIVKPVEIDSNGLQDAWMASSGEGRYAYLWEDKPHQLINRLLGHIAYLQASERVREGVK